MRQLQIRAVSHEAAFLHDIGGVCIVDWQSKTYGVVLGGGGAKGAYQIGVWRAMKETGIRYGGLIGTSVGSLNATLFALGDLDVAEHLWRSMRVEEVLGINAGLPGDEQESRWAANWKLTRKFARNGTFSMEPLRKLLKAHVNESKVRAACMPLGLVTWSLTAMKPVVAFLEDIPVGKLHDYLLASCCLPVFDNRLMNGERFLDGSVYDNLPVEPLYQRGFHDIISIDLSAMGHVREFMAPDLHHERIRSAESLGGLLHHNPLLCERNLFLGYTDAMKHFGSLSGHRYTFTGLTGEELRPVNLRFDLNPGEKAAVHELSDMAIMRLIRAIQGASGTGETTMDGVREIAADLLNIPRHIIRAPGSLEGEIRRELVRLSHADSLRQQARSRVSMKALAAFLKNSAEQPQISAITLLMDYGLGQAFWEALAFGRPEWVVGIWYLRHLRAKEDRDD